MRAATIVSFFALALAAVAAPLPNALSADVPAIRREADPGCNSYCDRDAMPEPEPEPIPEPEPEPVEERGCDTHCF